MFDYSCLNSLLQDEDQEDDYKSADDQVASSHEDVAAEPVDYNEESGPPLEEPISEEPAQGHFTSMSRESGVAPGNESCQHNIMDTPPSVITQTNMMR